MNTAPPLNTLPPPPINILPGTYSHRRVLLSLAAMVLIIAGIARTPKLEKPKTTALHPHEQSGLQALYQWTGFYRGQQQP